jgi:hemolysin III
MTCVCSFPAVGYSDRDEGIEPDACGSAARVDFAGTARMQLAPTFATMTTHPAEQLVPRLRGRLHVFAFWGSLVAASALVALAPSGTARATCAIYGSALCALFAVSALYHRWRWSPRWRPLLRRLDHSTIHVFIAASTTPLAVLVLDGRMQTFVLACAWVGALGGIALSLAWIEAPRALVAASYVLVGWAVLAAAPKLPERLSTAPLLLLIAGAIVYIAGAAVYAVRRPNPWPAVFGFHEVFHALVVIAAISHFVAFAGWVVPSAAAS